MLSSSFLFVLFRFVFDSTSITITGMGTNDANIFMDVQHSSNQQQQQHQQQQKKKCHGNRRDQRFRRKCRAQYMQPAKIEKLIQKRHRLQKKDQKNNPIKHTTSANATATDTYPNKRKRDLSLDQLSTVAAAAAAIGTTRQSQIQQFAEQPGAKKMKKNTQKKTTSNAMVNGNDPVHMHMKYQYVI